MFGKILGAILGFIFLRTIFGVIIGAVVGHIFIDGARGRRQRTASFGGLSFGSSAVFNRQDLFFQTFFNLLGKIAKIDGSISQEEHIYISNLLDNMKLQGDIRVLAEKFFNEGQNNPELYREVVNKFKEATEGQQELRTQLMYQLAGIASADKVITKEERDFLEEVAKILGVSESELNNHIKSFGAVDNQSYHILGVAPSASDEEVQAAYRKALKDYHPDILKSKGLAPSMLEFAEKRFLDIQNSWEQIKKDRNL